ncbi:MAG: class I SAM-dependent methyltransferase [Gemmatimonadaceae bacterium]|nr:class I SAM-dependent methyltransferase [Gemmatimonadaceae bacterium]
MSAEPVSGAGQEQRGDHFGIVARGYAAHRPTYPGELFAWLATQVPTRALAWDVGCGSGQASVALADHFERVVATDLNAQQIEAAVPHPRVAYHAAAAHMSGLSDRSVSLVTVAQALHWFDVDAFHAEVKRVLVPGGVIAEWTYSLMFTPGHERVGALVNDLDRLVHPWWPPERRHVDDHYAMLPFPFGSLEAPWFRMTAEWTKGQLLGYLSTWSAITRCKALTGQDLLAEFEAALEEAWGTRSTVLVEWPLTLRVGYLLR